MLKTDYSKVIIPITIIILNLIVKGIFIASNSIGGDEPFSIYHAQMDVVSIINQLSTGNNPPLYEILLHFWVKLFGISEMAVRIPSLIFSSITVLFLYKIGVRFFSLKVAIYSSLIFIFSNYQIFYAHEARVYSLMGMFTAISMYFYLKIITHKIDKKTLILLFASNILLIYSHYFGFFVLFIQLIFIFFNKNLIKEYWRFILLFLGLTLLFYLPNILTLINRFVSSVGGTWVKPPNGISSIYNILKGFTNAPVLASVVILLLVISIVKRFVIKPNKISIQTKFVLAWFIFPFFFMFFVSYWIPMFLDRYLIFVSIAFILLIAISADSILEKNYYKYIVPFIICILFIVTSKPNITNKRNVRETVQKIKALENDSTLVIICPYQFILNFAYYYDSKIFKNTNNKNIYENIDTDLQKRNIYGIYNIKDFNYKKCDNVVYLDAAADFSYPDNDILKTLEANYNLEEKSEFYKIFKVYKFSIKK